MAYTKTNWVNGTTPLNDKNMNKIENELENLDTNISKSTDEYSSTSTYSIGELVIYNNKLYKANQDITTAEAFNSSHWTEVTLLSDVNEIKSVVNNNADNLNKMDEGINAKQDKLTAGTGIEITGTNIINNLNANYSTEEVKIGTWIDGKPLYRKVIIINNTTLDKGDNTIAHGISNMDKGIKITCFNYGSGDYSGTILPCIELNADSSLKTATFITRIDSTNIFFRLINDYWGAQHKWCVIIEYTKTTD